MAVPDSAGTLDDELARAVALWRTAGTHTDGTLARLLETTAAFVRRLRAQGVGSFTAVTPAHAASFVSARTRHGGAPELATRHARRTALRTLFRTLRALGLHDSDPTMDLVLPPRGLLVARPLTDDEVGLCRASAQMGAGARSQMRAVAWALGEATALSSEVTMVRIRDVDDLDQPTAVQLPGTRDLDGRRGELSPWGRLVLRTRVNTLRAGGASTDTLLCYAGSAPPGGAKAQASACNALRHVLAAAGLGHEPDVRPASLRHWAGRRLFDQGAPIEEVARTLGHRSLDITAAHIGLDWRSAR
ncbi:MAG: tyrosine-type recombinase/integrase [Blastococcus sp.]